MRTKLAWQPSGAWSTQPRNRQGTAQCLAGRFPAQRARLRTAREERNTLALSAGRSLPRPSRAWAFILLLVLAGVLSQAWAADSPTEEYRVKGAFLLNFAKFVEWPAQAFKSPADPMSICILGANPFTPALDAAARQIVVDGRSLTLQQIQEPQQARQCQVVFVSVAERKRVRALLEAVKGESVLTVGESEGFVAGGGVIEFRLEESKVRIDISETAAKRAGLRISAKLLSLAQANKK